MPLPGRLVVAAAAVVAIVVSLVQLRADERGITRVTGEVQGTPIAVYRATGPGPGPGPGAEAAPVVVVAHGFAGSQRLMESFALHLAGRGYVVVTYDFVGHGRHPAPMTGALGDQDGTPLVLIRQTREVVDHALALPGVDGRLATVGHSMATNILVRHAQEDERVAATVAVSMFAPTIEPESPPNLLAVVGALEGRLEAESRRVVAMVADLEAEAVQPFVTYGDPLAGGARRLVVSPRVEHVGVLFSRTTLEETGAWLDAVFQRGPDASPAPAEGRALARGRWIALLLAGVFVLAWPLAGWLPRVGSGAGTGGANASWRRLFLVAGIPALLTPLLLALVPTSFLPVVVGDYVAVHFGTFGLLAGLLLWWSGGRPGLRDILDRSGLRGGDRGNGGNRGDGVRILGGAALMMVFFLVLMAWPLDRYFTAFFPVAERLPLLLAVLVGTLPYFVTDEWLTRGADARRGAYAVTKLLFLLSLGLAVALDFGGLFFLLIIVPVILVFFLVHGLFSRWIFRRTGSPLVAGLGNAVAFAWALAVTFPLYAGL
ncbi:MAG: alpha/beta fold hydrolase [Gemmatimonadales bacterium]|nr:MAG: alpha/beta fold hydrolase [Gemmatimonadales bacterium]